MRSRWSSSSGWITPRPNEGSGLDMPSFHCGAFQRHVSQVGDRRKGGGVKGGREVVATERLLRSSCSPKHVARQSLERVEGLLDWATSN